MVHGDDFVAVGRRTNLRQTRETLDGRYKLKVDMLGAGDGCVKEVKILNRVIRWTNAGITYEADTKHVNRIIKGLELDNSKGLTTPFVKEDKHGR